MKIAILSAGPSLIESYGGNASPYDLILGVNTAAAMFECDWWSVGDADRFEEITPIGNPDVFMIGAERDKVYRSTLASRLDGVKVEEWQTAMDATGITGVRLACPNWSATAALIFAKHLGATSIDVYGADMQGAADVTGKETVWRCSSRWDRERVEWAFLVKWLTDAGIEFNRVQL